MRRQNYVTPTSYLELIKNFKNLLNQKRMEILTLKNRYMVGLEKLAFSEAQVSRHPSLDRVMHHVVFVGSCRASCHLLDSIHTMSH